MTKEQIAYKLNQLQEDGLLDLLLQQLTNDIALEIVETDEMTKREELYQLTKAIKGLNGKLQDYANKYNEISEKE